MTLDKNKLLINQTIESNLIYDKPFEIISNYEDNKDIEFAYYIICDETIIKKIPYSKNNKLIYLPLSYKPHKVTVFIKNSLGEIAFKNSNILDNEEDILAIDFINCILDKISISVEVTSILNLPKEEYAFYLIKDNKIIEKVWYKKENKHLFNILYSDKCKYEVKVFVRILKNNNSQVMVSKTITPIKNF